MSTQKKTTTSEYLVICRGAWFDVELSPEDKENSMKQFNAWFERMSEQRKMKGGHQLRPEGKVIFGRKGVTTARSRNPRKGSQATGSFKQPLLRKR
jgi:hypothetical protein